MRLAIGAGRMRIVRQLLTESLVLAAAGAGVTVPIALRLQDLLVMLRPPTGYPLTALSGLNLKSLAFSAAVVPGCVDCLRDCAGAAQCEHRSKPRPEGGRQERDRGRPPAAASRDLGDVGSRARSGRLRWRRTLCQKLQGFSGNRSRLRCAQCRGGLSPAGLARYSMPERKLFCRRLRERLEAAPGVQAVGVLDRVPLGFDRGASEDVSAEGYVPAKDERMKIYRDIVSPGYFAALHIPILAGRDFTEQDDESRCVWQFSLRSSPAGSSRPATPLGRKMRAWGDWSTSSASSPTASTTPE